MLQKTLKKYKVFCKLLRNTGLALKTFVRSSEINFCKSDIDIYYDGKQNKNEIGGFKICA